MEDTLSPPQKNTPLPILMIYEDKYNIVNNFHKKCLLFIDFEEMS